MSRVTIAIFAVGIVASYWLLEGAFEQSDHRKALEVVRSLSQRGVTIEKFLEDRYPDGLGPPQWSTRVLSSCYGYVRVRYELRRRGGATVQYEFDVDLPRKAVHPADAATRALLEEFERNTVKTQSSSNDLNYPEVRIVELK